MIQVCCYKGCGVIYGEKEPLSDKQTTHGLCPKHLQKYLEEIKAEIEKRMNATGRVSILIVEDNPLFRQFFKETLHHRFPAVEIQEAKDGAEAIPKIEALHPNLIFMDIRLPGESGLQLTRKIKTQYPDIIVIILTAYDLPEYREASSQFADYFFAKDSLATQNIFSLIESILDVRV
jgi:CheY-like chemotaxis protein